jgi:hypothetical protein
MNTLLDSEPRPLIQYFSSSLLGKVPADPLWTETYLPLDRPGGPPTIESSWTYGRYFESIERVIAQDDFALLLKATQRQGAVPLALSDISCIRIYSEKHGNWYHPAKISLETPRGEVCFGMNVALHERGRAAMFGEVRALRHLAAKYPYPWVPQVYFFIEEVDFNPPDREKEPAAMFLTDWFEGYHEFHLSVDPADGKQKLVLWDGSETPHYLTGRQSREAYGMISRILTYYYDLERYEQIFPWHHGAGDFVLKVEEEGIDVRLVTVRQYGAMADPVEMDPEEALFFFFLNLSVRMRLDRLDGVGDMAWAEDDCLSATWQGFTEALRSKETEEGGAPGATEGFLKHWRQVSEEDLTERFLALIDSYDPQAPDLKVIAQGLPDHITKVHHLIKGRD